MKSVLTIIVPVYNGATTLLDTIKSIQCQSCSEFKVIFVDDGSTDNTRVLIQNKKRPEDRLIQKDNTGLYDTLNQAVAIVDTDWVSFLFQDDIVNPNYVEICSRIIREERASFVWFGINTIDEKGEVTSQGVEGGYTEMITPGLEPWRSALKRGTFWTISGSLSQTRALRELPFDPRLPHCGDYEFLLRALLRYKFIYIGDPLVSIRIHLGQASTDNLRSGRDLLERLTVIHRALAQNPEGATFILRMELVWHMAKQISFRVLSHVRRGRLLAGVQLMAKFPRIFSLLT